ncbi:MAG: hypothetical protein AB1743_04610, partial [Actinomycetota bacterium]
PLHFGLKTVPLQSYAKEGFYVTTTTASPYLNSPAKRGDSAAHLDPSTSGYRPSLGMTFSNSKRQRIAKSLKLKIDI